MRLARMKLFHFTHKHICTYNIARLTTRPGFSYDYLFDLYILVKHMGIVTSIITWSQWQYSLTFFCFSCSTEVCLGFMSPFKLHQQGRISTCKWLGDRSQWTSVLLPVLCSTEAARQWVYANGLVSCWEAWCLGVWKLTQTSLKALYSPWEAGGTLYSCICQALW